MIVRELDALTNNRMYIALRVLHAWHNGTAGYCAENVLIVHDWIDRGMTGPIPYPKSPFFREWAERNGFADIDGGIAVRLNVPRAT